MQRRLSTTAVTSEAKAELPKPNISNKMLEFLAKTLANYVAITSVCSCMVSEYVLNRGVAP